MTQQRTIADIDAEIARLRAERSALAAGSQGKVMLIQAYRRQPNGGVLSSLYPVARVGEGECAQYIVGVMSGYDEVDLKYYLDEEAFLKDWSFTYPR